MCLTRSTQRCIDHCAGRGLASALVTRALAYDFTTLVNLSNRFASTTCGGARSALRGLHLDVQETEPGVTSHTTGAANARVCGRTCAWRPADACTGLLLCARAERDPAKAELRDCRRGPADGARSPRDIWSAEAISALRSQTCGAFFTLSRARGAWKLGHLPALAAGTTSGHDEGVSASQAWRWRVSRARVRARGSRPRLFARDAEAGMGPVRKARAWSHSAPRAAARCQKMAMRALCGLAAPRLAARLCERAAFSTVSRPPPRGGAVSVNAGAGLEDLFTEKPWVEEEEENVREMSKTSQRKRCTPPHVEPAVSTRTPP